MCCSRSCFEGCLPSWIGLDGADPQGDRGAGHVVLASAVEQFLEVSSYLGLGVGGETAPASSFVLKEVS